jgi:hypothetical protein
MYKIYEFLIIIFNNFNLFCDRQINFTLAYAFNTQINIVV